MRNTVGVVLLLLFFALTSGAQAPPDETINGWNFRAVLWPGMEIGGKTLLNVGSVQPACTTDARVCLTGVRFTDFTTATLKFSPFGGEPEVVAGEISGYPISILDSGEEALVELHQSRSAGVYRLGLGKNRFFMPIIALWQNVGGFGTLESLSWFKYGPGESIYLSGMFDGKRLNLVQSKDEAQFRIIPHIPGKPILTYAFGTILNDSFWGFFQPPSGIEQRLLPGRLDLSGTTQELFEFSPVVRIGEDEYTFGSVWTESTGNEYSRGINPRDTGYNPGEGITSLGVREQDYSYVILNSRPEGTTLAVPNRVPGYPGSVLTNQIHVTAREIAFGFAFTAVETQPKEPFPEPFFATYPHNLFWSGFDGTFEPVVLRNNKPLFGTPESDYVRAVSNPYIIGPGQLLFDYITLGASKLGETYLVLATKSLVVQNGASFKNGVSPCSIATVFGSNLADKTMAADAYPLPSQLDGTRVTIGGITAPLYYISPTQINLQIPCDIDPGMEKMEIYKDAALLASTMLEIWPVAPGIFQHEGISIATHGDYSLVTSDHPAAPGEIVVFWGTGFGLTKPPAKTGERSEFSAAIDTPTSLKFGQREAEIFYAGISPGSVGLYQANVKIPADISLTGENSELTSALFAIAGKETTVSIWVRK